MVSRKAKLQATRFICDRLEESDLFNILSCDYREVWVRQRSELREHPATVSVLMPNFFPSIKAYSRRCAALKRDGVFISPILYKDGITAFRRLVGSGRGRSAKNLQKKTLKQYSMQQINQMLALRDIENLVQGQIRSPFLIFYQPSTIEDGGRLPESLRRFNLEKVLSDYAHKSYCFGEFGTGQTKYVRGRVLPTLAYSIMGPAKFKAIEGVHNYIAIVPEIKAPSVYEVREEESTLVYVDPSQVALFDLAGLELRSELLPESLLDLPEPSMPHEQYSEIVVTPKAQLTFPWE